MPTPTATPLPTAAAPTDPFVGRIIVNVTEGLLVRSQPRVGADSIAYEPLLPLGTELLVHDGPVSGSGYTWYEVSPLSFAMEGPGHGWVAMAAKDGEPWIALGPTSSPPIAADVHVVVAGDTLSEIAQRYDLTVDELLGANPQITDPSLIRVGDRITLVPACPPASAAPGSASWSILDLGAPLRGPAFAVRVNDRREVIVLGYPPSTEYTRGYLWRNGVTIDLGTLGGASTIVWDINNKGQVVGTSQTPSMEGHAFIWQNGVMTDLGSPGPYGADPLDINDRGQVVGEYTTASAHSGAFMWQDGVMTDLGTLGGDYARAEAINERGQIVGQSWIASGEMHAFLWEDGTMTDLGSIGNQGRIKAINSQGQVVGNRSETGQRQQAFIWQDGVMADLGALGETDSFAEAINDRGQVVGWAFTIGGEQRGFIWQDGVMTDLGTLGNMASTGAYAINDRGQVVGQSAVSGRNHGFFWQDGVMSNLGTLGGDGWAVDLNDRCMAVGRFTTPSGDQHAVLWTR